MGLKKVLLGAACAALLAAGCSREEPEGVTLMVDGAEASLPDVLPANLAVLHVRSVGAAAVFALHLPESLRELNLSSNRLPALPEDLVPSGVRRLWLADNALTCLPDAASGWTKLEYLNLDRNLVSVLPDLSRMPLRWLRLNGNRLKTLPPLSESIERLYLADNLLETAPPKPAALRQLTLAGNPLSAVPDDLGAGLEWLDLSRTQVAALPADLRSWRTLKVLDLARCPLPEAEKDRIQAAFDPYDTVVLF